MATILNLDERLSEIVNLCNVHHVIADIGCDHGLVTCELILENKAEMVISTEISRDCLNKAIILADKINILPFISFRECDGFKLVTRFDRVEQAVIAGMGGKNIIDIMENKPPRLWNFVLQPMNDTLELRQYLLSHRYKILVDKLIKCDGKYYDVLKVTKGRQSLTDLEIYFGADNFRNNYEVLYEYLQEKKQKLDSLKTKFGILNQKNEDLLYNINEALALFEQPEEQQKEQQEQAENQEQSNVENEQNKNGDKSN